MNLHFYKDFGKISICKVDEVTALVYEAKTNTIKSSDVNFIQLVPISCVSS